MNEFLPDAKDFWMQGRRLINAYGFTENVILVTSGIYGKDTLVNDIGTAMPVPLYMYWMNLCCQFQMVLQGNCV